MPFHKNILLRLQQSPLGNVGSQVGSFIKENPLLTGVGLAATAGGITALVTSRRRKKKSVKRKTRRRKSQRKAPRRSRRRIIRGRGLGRGEIKHSGRGTKGTKFVNFTTKDGRKVRFKVKGTSKRRKGFSRRRRRR